MLLYYYHVHNITRTNISLCSATFFFKLNRGSGALSDKMLLVRIVENDKIADYLGQVRLSKC